MNLLWNSEIVELSLVTIWCIFHSLNLCIFLCFQDCFLQFLQKVLNKESFRLCTVQLKMQKEIVIKRFPTKQVSYHPTLYVQLEMPITYKWTHIASEPESHCLKNFQEFSTGMQMMTIWDLSIHNPDLLMGKVWFSCKNKAFCKMMGEKPWKVDTQRSYFDY